MDKVIAIDINSEVRLARILLDIPVIWVSCMRPALIQILPSVSTNPFFPFFGPVWTVALLMIASSFLFVSNLGTKGTWPPVGSPAFRICLSILSGGVFATGDSDRFDCFPDKFSKRLFSSIRSLTVSGTMCRTRPNWRTHSCGYRLDAVLHVILPQPALIGNGPTSSLRPSYHRSAPTKRGPLCTPRGSK